jgi:hypothetical protein
MHLVIHLRWVAYAAWAVSTTASAQTTDVAITADSTAATKAFGAPLTNYIFSEQLNAGRKQIIANSLKANHPAKCTDSSAFSVSRVAPVRAQGNLKAWVEKYDIACEPRVRRNFLLMISGSNSVQTRELTPGDTIASMQLQHDLLPSLAAAAMVRFPTDCANKKDIKVTDTELLAAPKTKPGDWSERWTFGACGDHVSVDVAFTPDTPHGGTNWTFRAR